jgi:hypothetical protein
MKQKLLILNHSLLFLCVSIYLGTGWSLLLFSFPVAPRLTVDNYWLQFVPQVQAATRVLTVLTIVMIVLALVMCVAEWRSRLRWAPLVVLAGIGAATWLTMQFLFPYNQAMAAGITDPAELAAVLERWMSLNRVRVSIWTVQWLAMMGFFAIRTWEREVAREGTRMAVAGAGGDRGADRAERLGAAAGT